MLLSTDNEENGRQFHCHHCLNCLSFKPCQGQENVPLPQHSPTHATPASTATEACCNASSGGNGDSNEKDISAANCDVAEATTENVCEAEEKDSRIYDSLMPSVGERIVATSMDRFDERPVVVQLRSSCWQDSIRGSNDSNLHIEDCSEDFREGQEETIDTLSNHKEVMIALLSSANDEVIGWLERTPENSSTQQEEFNSFLKRSEVVMV